MAKRCQRRRGLFQSHAVSQSRDNTECPEPPVAGAEIVRRQWEQHIGRNRYKVHAEAGGRDANDDARFFVEQQSATDDVGRGAETLPESVADDYYRRVVE